MKKAKIIFGIIVAIFVILYLNLDNISNIKNWFAERSYYNVASEIAHKQSNYMYYGLDKLSNEMVASKAQAENWNFSGQSDLYLTKTGDMNFPYTTSIQYIFTDPGDKNHHHVLRDTYIFDYNHISWVPLSSSLTEYSSYGQFRPIKTYTMWQGDYQIPFFK
jgi:hypothetical protein